MYIYILTADNLFLLSSCNSSILSFEILVCMHRECESYSVFDCDCRFECVFDSWKRRKAKCNFLTETLLARLVLGLNLKCCRFFFLPQNATSTLIGRRVPFGQSLLWFYFICGQKKIDNIEKFAP